MFGIYLPCLWSGPPPQGLPRSQQNILTLQGIRAFGVHPGPLGRMKPVWNSRTFSGGTTAEAPRGPQLPPQRERGNFRPGPLGNPPAVTQTVTGPAADTGREAFSENLSSEEM